MLALITASCLGDQEGGHTVITDSAGVRLVAYAPRPSSAITWAFDSVAEVSIGVASGAEPYEFSRVVGAIGHPLGFLVADGGSGELRLFDKKGEHLRSVGGRGSGPGEFEAIRWMGKVRGDSIYAWDLRLLRLTILDPDLHVARTEPFTLPVPAYIIAGVLEDGDLLVWPFGSMTRPIESPQVVQDTSYFAIVAPSRATALDTIARIPARQVYVEPDGFLEQVPLTGDPSYAVGPRDIWLGNGGSGQVARYRKDGRVELIVRFPPGAQVTPQHRQSWVSTDLEHYSGSELAERTRRLEKVPFPTELPSFDIIRLDSEGKLWIRDYLLPESPTQHWTILNEHGTTIGSIAIPSDLRVLTIQRDWILGIWRDELDVEQIRVHRFTRLGPG